MKLAVMPPAGNVDATPSSAKTEETSEPEKKGAALDPRPKIQLPGDGRTLSSVATELGQVLAPCGIYAYAGEAAVYEDNAKMLAPIKPAKFRTWAEQFVIPFKITKEGSVDSTISSGDARGVLLSPQFLSQLREVERVNGVQLPVMRADGSVELLPEGYDRGSKILTTTDTVKYSSDMPLGEAKEFLDDLLKEFPFADERRSKALSIGAMVTLFALDLMPSRTIQPVFMYRGNLPGLGKGLLAQAAVIPVLGYAPTGVNPKNENEMRKNLFAVAKAGQAVVFFDNAEGRFASPCLESFTTTSTVSGRVLGSSTALNCRKNSVVFITGNGCTLSSDMARRTLIAELFLAQDPGGRTIVNHLDENRLLEMRPQILGALYALVREWASAGKPKPTKINPNFVVWSQVIGGIVEHAGFGSITDVGPVGTAVDPHATDMPVLGKRLYAKHLTEAVKFGELVAVALENHLLADILKPGHDLSKADNTALGRICSSFDQRIFAPGLRFVVIGKGHARRYAVQKLPALEDGTAT